MTLPEPWGCGPPGGIACQEPSTLGGQVRCRAIGDCHILMIEPARYCDIRATYPERWDNAISRYDIRATYPERWDNAISRYLGTSPSN
jgi:hypothetical protein